MKTIISKTITKTDKKVIFNDLIDDFTDLMSIAAKNKVLSSNDLLTILEDASNLLEFSLEN